MFPTPFLLQFTKNLCHRDDNESKTPRGLGSGADLFHRVQHRFAEFNFNCLYVDCMTESSVLFVNWSVVTVIRLQNSYKQKKTIPLRVHTESANIPVSYSIGNRAVFSQK